LSTTSTTKIGNSSRNRPFAGMRRSGTNGKTRMNITKIPSPTREELRRLAAMAAARDFPRILTRVCASASTVALSTAPDRFEPIYRRKPNRDIDARPWCRASMPLCSCGCQPRRPCSTPTTSTTACSCPSSCIASTIRDIPCSDQPRRDQRARHSCARRTRTSRPSSKPCANTGCRSATAATRQAPDGGDLVD
jgi:hypothetical protein